MSKLTDLQYLKGNSKRKKREKNRNEIESIHTN